MAKKKIFHNSDKDTRIDSIGKAIQYLYYRYSEFYKKTEGELSIYNFKSFCLIWFLFVLNFATLFFFLMATDFQNYFYKLPKFQPYFLEKLIYGGSVSIVIFFVIYFLIKRKSYQNIYNTYNKEPYSQRVKRGRLIVVYMVLSVILFAISGYIMEQNRSEEWKKEHRKKGEIPKIQFKLPKKKDTIKQKRGFASCR